MSKILIEVTAFEIKHTVVLESDAKAEEFIEKCFFIAGALGYDSLLTIEAMSKTINKYF